MNKTTKPIKPVMMQPKPLTKEEQAQRFAQFLAQKKEQLFQGCLFSLLSNPNVVTGPIVTNRDEVMEKANELADLALKKMYNLDGKEGK